MKRGFFVLLLIFIYQFLLFADISVESYVDKTKVGINDYIKLTIEFTGENANKIRTPDISKIRGFTNLGSSSSSSSNIVIVNGKMERTVTKSFTYKLQPQKEGTFLIPPINIRYKKQNLNTAPFRITVVEESQEPTPPTSNKFNRNEKKQSDKLTDNLFLIAEVDNRNVYKDEPITVNYRLYTKYDISNLSFAGEPNFNKFWKENIFTPSKIKFTRTNYKGTLFNTMLMRSVALFPSDTGNLIVPSLELLVDIRTKPASFFDFGSVKRYTIKSKSVGVKVKELPIENRPQNFSGAVGNFNFSSKISDTEIKVGDSFTYTLEIRGTGNIKHFDIPVLPELQHLRFIDPEVSIKINDNKISGTKTIKYLVIAQEKGSFTIPSISFSFFDTNQKKYITKKTRSYTINVAESDLSYIPSSSAQTLVQREGSDIGFIIKDTTLLTHIIYFNNFLYWLIWFLVLLSILISLIYMKEQEKLSENVDYLRQKKALRILKKYMKKATEYSRTNNVDFYYAIQTGLSSYLADKLRINRGSSAETILLEIKQKNLSEDLYDKIQDIFNKCNQARFMPGGFSEDNIKTDYFLLKEIVSEISKVKF